MSAPTARVAVPAVEAKRCAECRSVHFGGPLGTNLLCQACWDDLRWYPVACPIDGSCGVEHPDHLLSWHR